MSVTVSIGEIVRADPEAPPLDRSVCCVWKRTILIRHDKAVIRRWVLRAWLKADVMFQTDYYLDAIQCDTETTCFDVLDFGEGSAEYVKRGGMLVKRKDHEHEGNN